MVERDPVSRALIQNRRPTQAGLSALQHQELEQRTVIMDRDTPFLVVIGHQQRIARRPRAPLRIFGWRLLGLRLLSALHTRHTYCF